MTVRCAVDAHPATDLSFRWMFNSTLAMTEVPNSSISTSGWQSNVTHRVYQNEQQDYGTLLCWARNAIGEQRDPCIFSIQPAGLFLISFSFLVALSLLLYYLKQNRSIAHSPLLAPYILFYCCFCCCCCCCWNIQESLRRRTIAPLTTLHPTACQSTVCQATMAV